MPLRRSTPVAPRRGVVLLAVMVVVAILALAAYQYGEWMNAEYHAADGYGRSLQARALAESGIHYTAALLSNADAYANTLNGNPWDNASIFQDVAVGEGGSGQPRGRFSIVTLLDPDDPNAQSQPYRFGVSDEAGKINVNALLALDNGKGDLGFQILMKLPNMTEDVANAILDWIDPDDEPRSNGAENDYYQSLDPPYQAKNGPIDSLEELLLVRGVTAQLLFGNDRNRNGVLDPGADDGSGQIDRGWSAYLTVYSREPNADNQGSPRIYLNDSDLNALAENLTTALGPNMANYIIAYRLYGAASTGTGAPGAAGAATGGAKPAATGAAPAGAGAGATVFVKLSDSDNDAVTTQIRTARSAPPQNQQPKPIGSVYDLIGSSVNVPTGTGPGAKTISMPSPLNDPGQMKQLLPLVLDQTTTTLAADLTPRININTASQTVLETLPGLEDGDIQNILNTRPDPSSSQDAPDPIFQTPAWLLTEANLTPAKVKAIAAYITARTLVYRFQVVGYFNGTGLATRVEVIVDSNFGRPRIVYRRDLSELGRGFPVGVSPN